MKIFALIQVRMKSERLPGKALLPVDGIPVIEHVVANLRRSAYINDIVLCTTRENEDNLLEAFAASRNVSVFRGDVDNVIGRFYHAAREYGSDVIVRIAGDCPIVSSEAADLLIRNHLDSGADYTSIEPNTTPIGSFPQVFSFEALERLTRHQLDFSYSEYMLYYFTNNPSIFSLNIVSSPAEYNHPEFRLTLDYEEDLRMFDRLFRELRQAKLPVTLRNVLFILNQHPDISRMNSHLIPEYQNIYDDLMDTIRRATTIVTPLRDV